MIWSDEFEWFGLVESDERLRPNYSIAMVKLDGRVAGHLRYLASHIPDHHLAGIGREPNPHITVLYGLHDTKPHGAKYVLNREKPAKVRFGKVSTFENPNFDVLKVDVQSDDLDRMHKKLKYLPHTQKYPHVLHTTVAYVKKGMGKHYADKLNNGISKFDGYEHTYDHLIFSEPKGRTEHHVPLGNPTESVINKILAGHSVDETLTAAMVGTQPVSGFGFVRPIFPNRRRYGRRSARV